MKIAVIGAGIIGITTAYELACDGHEVTVLERRGAAAEEASFANGGLVAPGLPIRVMGGLFSRHGAVKIRLPISAGELAWLWRAYRASRLEAFLANQARLQGLAFYSRARLHHITADLKLECERGDGRLVLLRSEKSSKLLQPSLQLLRDAGVAFKEFDPAQARNIETALNPDAHFFGAIHLPDDEVGNCRQFALLLKNEAQRMGVNFAFNTRVTRVLSSGGIGVVVAGDSAPRQFDAIVLCAGLDSARLLAPLGLKIALAGVHGYSVSAAIREPLNAPRSVVTDEHFQISISRLGKRVRVSGCAELGGSPDKKNADALAALYKVLHHWFPGAANQSSGVQEWKGTRAMLPDAPPIVGASGIAGLWLNLGHGASGWALSCGSARALADLIGSRTPEIDVSGLGAERLSP